MRGNLRGQNLRYQADRCAWLAGVSILHSIFDSHVKRRAPFNGSKVLAICVYRRRNVAVLWRWLAEAVQRHWEVRLWALDEVDPGLKRYTYGAGAGARCALLNSLIAGASIAEFDWVIVADDDFEFHHGSLASFLGIAQAAGLSLAQPAHVFSDYRAYAINRGSRFAVARLTTFVEIGPVFAVNRAWASRVLPFPEGFEMGWGLALIWSDFRKEGARLGIVDWVTIKHLTPFGKAYDNLPEQERLDKMLRDRGLNSIEAMQETLAVWPPWSPRAPWLK